MFSFHQREVRGQEGGHELKKTPKKTEKTTASRRQQLNQIASKDRLFPCVVIIKAQTQGIWRERGGFEAEMLRFMPLFILINRFQT